jgi:hypothetical protein
MGKIVITTNMSLDGVVQDPDGEEGFRLGGWFREFGGKDLFGETSDKKPLRLVHSHTIGDGLACVTYKVVRDA